MWDGGFLGGLAAVIWVMRRRKLPVWATLDAATLGLALGYGVGRLGCFLVGDDYGRPTDLPWGMSFPVGLPPTTAGMLRSEFHLPIDPAIADEALVKVHPTQIYETLLALLIWGVGLWLLRRRPRAGTVGLVVIGLLALERFGVEFLRAKDDRFFGPLTLAQAISLVVLAVTVVPAPAAARRGRGRLRPARAR